MNRTIQTLIVAVCALLAGSLTAWAVDNYAATAGSGLTFAAKDATGVLYSRFILCDNTTVSQCALVDASGNVLTTSSNTTSTTNSLALNGANTLAVAMPNSTGTVGITITNLSATGASLTLEASEDGGASWVTANCVTATSGAIASVFSANNSCRMNAAGRSNFRLRVSTTGTGTANIAYTLSRPTGGVFLSAPIPAGTNAIGTVSVPTWAGGTLGAMANYGTSPGAVLVPGVNAFVTNTNANGQATMANSSPVTMASNQAAQASAGQVAVAAAPPSGATYKGVLSGGATGGLIRGEIQCDTHKFFHITSATDTLVAQGVTSQKVYICAWRARAAGVATWALENTADTNANCAGSKTQITGVATEAANTGETFGGAVWGGLTNTVSNGLCIVSTGTGGVDIDIWYAQF